MFFQLVFDWGVPVVLGLIVGSFMNVVIHRLPRDRSVVRPRSHCPKCKKSIAWYDNVPILGYMVLGGRCRRCKTKISFRYPMVEILVALLFLAGRVRFGWDYELFIRVWPFLAMLIAITFIDLEHRLIPDELSLGGLVLGMVTSVIASDLSWVQSLAGAGLGFAFFYGFAWAYERWTGRSGLGGGDIKLLAMLGAFIGIEGVFTTILLSSILGSLVGLIWAATAKKKNMMKFAIPYGPFLAIGALYVYLIGERLWLPFTIPM